MTADLVARLRECIGNEYMDETARRRLLAIADEMEAASALRSSGEAAGFHRIRVVDWNEIAMAMPLGDDTYAKGYQDAMDAVTKCLNLHPATVTDEDVERMRAVIRERLLIDLDPQVARAALESFVRKQPAASAALESV